jgi:hypothetical protein
MAKHPEAKTHHQTSILPKANTVKDPSTSMRL